MIPLKDVAKDLAYTLVIANEVSDTDLYEAAYAIAAVCTHVPKLEHEILSFLEDRIDNGHSAYTKGIYDNFCEAIEHVRSEGGEQAENLGLPGARYEQPATPDAVTVDFVNTSVLPCPQCKAEVAFRTVTIACPDCQYTIPVTGHYTTMTIYPKEHRDE